MILPETGMSNKHDESKEAATENCNIGRSLFQVQSHHAVRDCFAANGATAPPVRKPWHARPPTARLNLALFT